jgi:hypothetical protein
MQKNLSTEAVEEQKEYGIYSVESLNLLSIARKSAHKLRLTDAALVILKRNINGEQGLWTVKRLKVCCLAPTCIDAMTTGTKRGMEVFIPRIKLVGHSVCLVQDSFRCKWHF